MLAHPNPSPPPDTQPVDGLVRTHWSLAVQPVAGRTSWTPVAVAEVILTYPRVAERRAVADLLNSQRHWGQARVRKFLASVAISENKTIGSMTEHQRQVVAARLTMPG
jgi:hypothetical protein